MIPLTPKAFLEAHKGNKYSIAWNGVHRMKWSETSYTGFDPRINLCQLNHNELIFEADYKADESYKNAYLLDKLKQNLKARGVYYLETSHKGKSNYVWVVLSTNDNRIITEAERKAVLKFFECEGLVFDEALAYLNFVRPIPNAIHWKHNKIEEVIEINQGIALNIDTLNLSIPKPKLNKSEYQRNFWASKINIEVMAKRHGLTLCPECNNPFSFDVSLGKFSCVNCNKSGNIQYFVKILGVEQ